ncbi:unnamed protein product [Heterosigma akashiwo]
MAKTSKPRPPPSGLVFPPGPKGDRGSTWGNKETIAAAFEPLDPKVAQAVRNERNWRQNYVPYIQKLVELGLASKEKALASAQAGMDWAYNNFEFIRDGQTMSLKQAMDLKGTFGTGHLKGEKPKVNTRELEINHKGKVLRGAAIIAQVQAWARYGTIEPSCRDAILRVLENQNEWLDLSDRYFVLLGAGSAMGPYPLLMALGANVIAVDLDREAVWARLMAVARDSPGTLTFPLKLDMPAGTIEADYAKYAGCNLFTQTPEIANWLCEVHRREKLVVGSYAYLDGALHVQVSLAMDAIVSKLVAKRGPHNVALAYLCTPTDCHVIGADANEAAQKNYSSLGLTNLLIKLSPFFWTGALAKNALRPVTAEDGTVFHLVDGVVGRQGPNYILAKRLQHWRAMLSHAQGCVVSSNVAPSTSTVSVTKNKLFALAYQGMHYFRPFEVATPALSNSAMTALLVHDLRNAMAPANGAGGVPLRNPLELFTHGSFHGGVWRCAYKIESVGTPAAVFYLLMRPILWLTVAVMALAVIYS